MSLFKKKKNSTPPLSIEKRESIRDEVFKELEGIINKAREINGGTEHIEIKISEFKERLFEDNERATRVSNSLIAGMILHYTMQHSQLSFWEVEEDKIIKLGPFKEISKPS